MKVKDTNDIVGHRFDRLVVVSFSGYVAGKRRRLGYLCQCDCGSQKVIQRDSLLGENTRSCGCLKIDFLRRDRKRTPESYQNRMRNQTLAAYKANSLRYGRQWSISDERFFELIQHPCNYCGTTNSNVTRYKSYSFTYNGLDRIDSSLGYCESNIVPCCKTCNYGKNDMSRDGFVAHLKKAGLHMLQKEEFGGYGLTV